MQTPTGLPRGLTVALLLLLTGLNFALLVLSLVSGSIPSSETPAFVSEALARLSGPGTSPPTP